MLKTLDILIGATTILLLFSMAVTVITQAITGLFQRKGRHLKAGLADLLQQLGISDPGTAQTIAEKVLTHPMIASVGGKLGTVIHRDEFTRLLLDLSSGQGAGTLGTEAKNALLVNLKQNGISDPAETLRNVHDIALRLEASNPEIANHVRDGLAMLQGAPSEFVARVNSWFDQCIDRVSDRFTKYTHRVVFGVSAIVVLVVQLDMIAVVNRLSIDDQFRDSVVKAAATDFSNDVNLSDRGITTSSKGDSTKTAPTGGGQSSSPSTPAPLAGASATPPASGQSANASTSTSVPPTRDSSEPPSAAVQRSDAEAETEARGVNPTPYYDLLGKAGLLTQPFGSGNWWGQLLEARKWPGMVISILLLSLGAPFWYNALKDLLKLRSTIAGKDDAQRAERQSAQAPSNGSAASGTSPTPGWLKGESGDLGAAG